MTSRSQTDPPGGNGRPAPAGTQLPTGVRVASEWAWRLGAVAVGLYLVSRVLEQFGEILVAVLIALLLSALLHPLTEFLARVLPHALAALATLLFALLVILGLIALVGQQSASGFGSLRSDAVSGISQVQHWLATGPLHVSSTTLSGYVTRIQKAISANQSTILSGALGAAATVTKIAEGFFITMFATFFFLSSGRRIWAWLLRILPMAAQDPLDDAARAGWVTLSHYVRATTIVAIVDGLGVGIGSGAVGVPLAIPLGVVVFLGAFVPVVGALVTGILAVLVALVAKGPVVALIVLGVVIAVNQLEAHILQPFLLGRSVEVHPLAVILAIAAGSALAGVLGALFAVPTVAVTNTMITALAGRGKPPGDRIADEDAPLAPDKPRPTDVPADSAANGR